MPDALPNSAPASEIVITGTALPAPAAERVYKVDRIARRDIDRAASRTVDQLLKDLPGLQLFRRSDSRSGHPTSQGITLRALGGNASNRALLVLDGVPQADPFGGWVNWPSYDPLDLGEVRVVRGGGSVGNGPGALAATIEMTSRTDAGAEAEGSAGSRSAVDGSLRAGLATGGGLITLSANAARGDGFVPITSATRGAADQSAAYRNWGARARWAAPVGRDIQLQANLSGFHDWRSRGTAFTANHTDGLDASVRLVGQGAIQWRALLYWQWRDLMSSFANVGAGRATATRVSLQDAVPSQGVGASLEARRDLAPGVELRVGADLRKTRGESRELYAYTAGEPTRRRRAGGESFTAGMFAEASAQTHKFTFTGGLRLDHWAISNGHLFERLIASQTIIRDDDFKRRDGWLPTARGGVRFDLSPALSLRSTAYTGWRLPTLNELFRPFRAGQDAVAANPNLDPERLIGAEAGLDWQQGPLHGGLTVFANRLKNAIANVTLGEGPGVFPGVGFVTAGGTYRQRRNVDAIKVRGIEVSLDWSRGPWSARAAASLTHARLNVSGPAAPLDGLRPAQTPGVALTLSGGYEERQRGMQVTVRRVGNQFEDDLNSRRLKGATTIDATAFWPVLPKVQLIARAENLFNALIVAGIGSDGAVERATPRTLWLGLRLSH